MIRVNVVVEGQTERSFVGDVLAPTLWAHDIYLFPILLGVPGHKGGRPNYARVKKDILLNLKQDGNSYCSTMLDFYGLGAGFPGAPRDANATDAERAEQIEHAVKADICATIPDCRPDVRLIPYLQLHEYEGLLFSDPQAFAAAINQASLGYEFQKIRDRFATPEDINDNPNTAPSKRVENLYPNYRKVLHGTDAARAVGIETMRRECPHFGAWVEKLKSLRR